MIQELINNILFKYSYLSLYLLTFLYFLILYFGVGQVFLRISNYLNHKNIIHKIVKKEVSKKQIRFEIYHSLKSIFIFGFSILPIIYLFRNGKIIMLPNTTSSIFIGLIVLIFWNEIHFFIIHRIMHIPFFMKNVHRVHHKSKITTVYSVFSFHWLEALLLSTVPITIIPFFAFAPLAIFIYPFISILINFSAHCNYRFGNGKKWQLIATQHNQHHYNLRKNYAFALNKLDHLYVWLIKLIKKNN